MLERLIVLICWGTCMGAVAATAQERVGAVRGRVLTLDGAPVAAAELVVRGEGPAGSEWRLTVTPDGRFEVSNVPPGVVRLRASAPGFTPVLLSSTVVAGAVTDVAVTLVEAIRESVLVVGHRAAAGEIPGAAEILDAAEMNRVRLATADVHQMLRQIPGLNIQDEDGYGLRPNIGIRGSGSDRSSKVTLMEDGVLIAPAPYAAPAAYYSPTASRMEALEVRKGSSQVKYGPITTAGVVNFVSTSIPSTYRLRASVAGGGDNTRRLSANIGNSHARLGWLVEAHEFQTDGFKRLDGGGATGSQVKDALAKLRFRTEPRASFYQEVLLKIGRTDQRGDETYLGLTDADFAASPRRRYAASQVDRFTSEHEQYQLRHLVAGRSWNLTSTLYRHNFSRSWYKLENVLGRNLGTVLAAPSVYANEIRVLTGDSSDPNALAVRDNNRRYFGQGLQSVVTITTTRGGVAHEVEAGIRLHQDEEDRFQHEDGYQMTGGRMVRTRAGAPGSQTNQVVGATAIAGFVSAATTIGRITLRPGARVESIDFSRVDYARTDPDRTAATGTTRTSVDVVVPGIGLTYAATRKVSAFVGAHKGFAPPGPGAAAETRAEASVNYEAGVRARHGRASIDVVTYLHAYSNLIGRDTLSSGGAGDGSLFNGGRSRVGGLEASLSAPSVLRSIRIPVRLAYTYTSATFRNSFQSQYGPWGTVTSGDQMPYVPAHQLTLVADLEREAWRVRVEANAASRMRTTAGQGPFVSSASTVPHLVVGLSGQHRLGASASLFASLQNVTNSLRVVSRHPFGVRPGAPRSFVAGLTFELDR